MPGRDNEHYLKQELYQLVRSDPRLFEWLQDGSLDGIWYWDLEDGDQEWMSPRFWSVLGVDPATKEHRASEWQGLIHEEDRRVALENAKRHFDDPSHPYDQVVRYRHADGSTVWVRCRGLAIRDESGTPTRMLGAHNEVTDLKRAEYELRQIQAGLEGAVAARTAELEEPTPRSTTRSRSAPASKRSGWHSSAGCSRPSAWRASASWPVASRTTSTTC